MFVFLCFVFLAANEGCWPWPSRWLKNQLAQKQLEQKQLEQKQLEQKQLAQKQLEQKQLEQKQLEQKQLEQKQREQKQREQKQLEQKQLEEETMPFWGPIAGIIFCMCACSLLFSSSQTNLGEKEFSSY